MSAPLDFPIALRLGGQPVLMVGGGRIALGRVKQLVEVGAQVKVVATRMLPDFAALEEEGAVKLIRRAYVHGDCAGARLVFAATDDPRANRAVVAEARSLGILANAADMPGWCDFAMPSIGRRGPVAVAVSTSGEVPGLARVLKDLAMGVIREEHGRLATKLGALRRSLPKGAERARRIADLLGSLRLSTPPARGTVYLVGAGPGDPRYLTLRAAELLREADAVVYDRLVHVDTLRLARTGARLIYVGKEGGGEQVAQEEIHRVLIEQARLGRSVVRLKGGDPFVFGRGGEEVLALAEAGVPFEVVPGLSSGVAAPALAGIPVTHREVSAAVTFATASSAGSSIDWEHLARSPTLVLFMAGTRLAGATVNLIEQGRSASTPAAVVEAAGWESQRVIQGTLETIAEQALKAEVGSPSILVVGEVVALRDRLELARLASEAGPAGGDPSLRTAAKGR